ncbi:MAG: cyclic nucleotide-binding domain-containing protein [Chloroflexi bacterium]|nr:cyclic nucleotide-binding domain-containing protein [Chloroflexota bacterium]
MISPELLRRYPFFGKLNDEQLRAIAMISEEVHYAPGDTVLKEGNPADWLCLLMEGGIDLFYKSEEAYYAKTSKMFHVGEINPEEVFGISALIEPYTYNASSSASQPSRLIQVDAKALRALIELDRGLGYVLIKQLAKTAIQRLEYTRVQLAAAQS